MMDKEKIFNEAMITGDLSQLSQEQRIDHYLKTCQSLGLNPRTKPFEYILLNGKLQLYAKKDATEQLRSLRKISLQIVNRQTISGCYVVTVKASLPDGRIDESTGAVSMEKENGTWKTTERGKRYFEGDGTYRPLSGDDLANAIMKAETKAKRRATLSICGLGFLDETEVETISSAKPVKLQDDILDESDYDQTELDPEPTEKEQLIAQGDRLLSNLPETHAMKTSWESKKSSLSVENLKKTIAWMTDQIAHPTVEIQKAEPLTNEQIQTYIQAIQEEYGEQSDEIQAFGGFIEKKEWMQATRLGEGAIALLTGDGKEG